MAARLISKSGELTLTLLAFTHSHGRPNVLFSRTGSTILLSTIALKAFTTTSFAQLTKQQIGDVVSTAWFGVAINYCSGRIGICNASTVLYLDR